MTRWARFWAKRLRRDRRGAALLEFALGFPLVFYMGGYGIELSNYAVTHMRVSQIALTLADNASRIGSGSGQSGYQVREADLNDLLLGARVMGAGIKLTTYGRVTLSSLENIQRSGNGGFSDHSDDLVPVQRLHWQRCIGLRGQPVGNVPDPGYDSSYAAATPLTTAGTTLSYGDRGVEMPLGWGPTPLLNAPPAAGVMFVEINYQYHPLFGSLFLSASKIHYLASFIVRDQRAYAQITNPNSSVGTTVSRATCDLHSS